VQVAGFVATVDEFSCQQDRWKKRANKSNRRATTV